MILLLKENRTFFLSYLLFVLSALFLIITFGKTDSHLLINNFHQPWLDVFFKFSTYLGNGFIMIPLVLILLFIRYSYAIMMVVSYAFSSALVQFTKHVLCPDFDRPYRYFGIHHLPQLHLVGGVDVNSFNSMPSGHTATAFGACCLLALLAKNKRLGLIFFLAAFLVGFSRVYLSQHFLEDVVVGSAFGIICSLFAYYLFEVRHIINMPKGAFGQKLKG